MQLRNADPPYRDTADALSQWLETATTVTVRLRAGQVEVLAPYGVDDLLGLELRPTPVTGADPGRMEVYRRRVCSKGWAERWPCLTVLGMKEGCP